MSLAPHAADPLPPESSDPAAPLLRIVDWLLWLTLVLTLVVDLARLPRATSPALVVAACAAMVLVTAGAAGAAWRWPGRDQLRSWALVATGILVALATPFALPPDLRTPSLAGFWIAAGPTMVLLSSASWQRGLYAAVLAAVASLLALPEVALHDIALAVVFVAAGSALGWTVQYVRRATVERERERATSAALAERQRLSRIVHDGVLQVLAMVEREGQHLGPRGAMLARMAHEQEAQLRSLIQQRDIDPERRDPRDATHSNFAVLLDRHASRTVSVATPAEPLLMESHRAAELDAAVTEALSNVVKHAGPAAQAWVFLEIDGNEATLSVRDNGVGGEPERFAEAMRNGRMGMKHSIYGRIHDLGGTATLRSAPGRGTEWEFRVPIEV